jgi:sugar phosphate isomerase/epimerase
MRLTLSTADCAGMDFSSIAAMAARQGIQAIALAADRSRTGATADALSTSPEKISRIVSSAGVAISAIHIGSGIDEFSQRISLAIQLQSPFVICSADRLFTRSNVARSDVLKLLKTSADQAAAAGVSILIENQSSAGSALRLWHLLDELNHPSVGCFWNTFHAGTAGDKPAIAVPLLNLRIMAVLLKDGVLQGDSIVQAESGAGQLPLKLTINRLRGIGFDGDVQIGTAPTGNEHLIEQSLALGKQALEKWKLLGATKPAAKLLSR